jgi:predicted Zn-dependent protease
MKIVKSQSSPSPLLLLNFADELMNTGRRDDAKKIYQGILDLLPGNTEASIQLGRLHMEMNCPDDAIKLLSGANRQTTKDVVLFALLGATFQSKGMQADTENRPLPCRGKHQ